MLADETSTLTPSTSKSAPNKVLWFEEMDAALTSICESVSNVCKLCVLLPEDVYSICTDAYGKGIGGVLQVKRNNKWEAAAFFSRKLRGAEHTYAATELEALALVETLAHFQYYLYGRKFVAYTDHQPLRQLKTSDHLNSRLKRMALKLMPWNIEIVYTPREDNLLPDALSRQEWEIEPGGFDLAAGDVRD